MEELIIITKDKKRLNGILKSVSELKRSEYGEEYFDLEFVVAVKKKEIVESNLISI